MPGPSLDITSPNDETIQDLLTLLAIEGPPAKEGRVSAWLQSRLKALGIPESQISEDNAQAQSEYGGEVGNLIVHIPGKRPGPTIMFSTHMDTVPDAVGCAPELDPANRRIVNRAPGKALGGDNRLGCAALLHLTRALVATEGATEGDHPNIVLVFFVQEEVGLVGARGLDLAMLGEPRPAMCYNLDGGIADEFVVAVTGTTRFTIDITGVSAHAGSRPAEGVSAGIIAARALADLDRDGWHGRIEQGTGDEKKLGSANLGILQGGQGSNVVMPALHILAEARSHDPVFRRQIIERWQAAFTQAAQEVSNLAGERGSVQFGPGPAYESFALSPNEPTVARGVAAAERCGFTPALVSNDGGMDANWIVAHGIPAITIGVGQRAVHRPAEWIALDDFAKTCGLLVEIATMA